MEKKKSIFTIQNFIILILIIIIGVMFFVGGKEEKDVEQFKLNLAPPSDYTYCQRIFYYDDADVYSIAACDGEVHIKKNDKDEKKVDVKNAAYIYEFYTADDHLVYILTQEGDVYYLSKESLRNVDYTVEKIDVNNIYSITSFHLGKARDDAYTHKIYAVDKDGKFHLIKSGI